MKLFIKITNLFPLQWRPSGTGRRKLEISHTGLEVGGLLKEISKEPRSSCFLVESRIALEIQRGSGVSVMGSIPSSSIFEEVFY